jgi:predicted nucleotidyltransferase component of viral defense system
LKRSYDFEDLARRQGFNPRQIEKVCRIADLLEDLSNVPFLRDRLSLYGGTALSFIHLDRIQRLSIDLDFNYRHLDDRDWGEVREDIDDQLKRVLYAQNYAHQDLAITATYPLGRITVRYRNSVDQVDSFVIEVGYMRRIPVLHEDHLGEFRHLGTGETFLIKTPKPEELYANKWCTFLYRGSSRDLFDVYQISKTRFDRAAFRKCAIVDSLMRGRPKLHEINIETLVDSIQINSALRNLLLGDTREYDFKDVRQEVIRFSRRHLNHLTRREIEGIEGFYKEYSFNPEPIDPEGILNKQIREHPMIKRALENLRN